MSLPQSKSKKPKLEHKSQQSNDYRDSGARQTFGKRPRNGRIGPVSYQGTPVPHFFQGDNRWANTLMNHDETISNAGCAICCCASVLKYFGRDVDPNSVDLHMNENGGYVDGSDSIQNWDIPLATGATPDLIIKSTENLKLYEGGDEAHMNELIEESLNNNIPIIGRVKYGDSDQPYNHFVVIIGRSANGHHLIVDPGLSQGDGNLGAKQPNVIIETATRRNGLKLVGIIPLTVVRN